MGNAQSNPPSEVRRIVWADEALANLDSIARYIDDFSPLAAQCLALRIQAAADSLSDYADRGRDVGGGRRELTIIYPYVIRYTVSGDIVRILRIRHGARRPG